MSTEREFLNFNNKSTEHMRLLCRNRALCILRTMSSLVAACLPPQKQILIHSGPPSANRPSCTIHIVQCAPSQNWQTLNKNNCGETVSKASMLDTFCSHSFSLHLFGLRWLPDSNIYPKSNKQPWKQPMKVNVKHTPNCTATYMLTHLFTPLLPPTVWFIHGGWLGCKANISWLHHCVGKLLLVWAAC